MCLDHSKNSNAHVEQWKVLTSSLTASSKSCCLLVFGGNFFVERRARKLLLALQDVQRLHFHDEWSTLSVMPNKATEAECQSMIFCPSL
jgi:hypothetical protein